ncbi:hypothetical protein NDU88_003021 [Pleurodeles waltl]|uniref:Coagulation factor X n=1 Tax=Pleurodeles waltl TaxID=8319 RepID=A0AAV7LLT3_PLEWA|nr:hypothetical protein NDU88_003021 [Pleurodeles waltl]
MCHTHVLVFLVFIRRNEANRVLRVHKRSNQFLEEIKAGNLERECYEETCSFEEAREIFKAQEKTTEFWFHYKDLNPCKVNPCHNGGLCQQYHYNYKFECWYKNGGCLQYCQDDGESQDVTCSCAEGYMLDGNGKTCSPSALFPCGLTKSSTRSFQEDAVQPLQDDSTWTVMDVSTYTQKTAATHSPQEYTTQSLLKDSMHSLHDDSSASLQDNSTHSLLTELMHSLQGNFTKPLQDNSTHSFKDVFMDSLQDYPTTAPQDNFTSSHLRDIPLPLNVTDTYPHLDNVTHSVLGNSTHLKTNCTGNTSSLDYSVNNNNKAQDDTTLKFMDGNTYEGNWDDSISLRENLELNDTRIVGGVRCYLGGCPWQVLIRNFKGQDFCGGSLISSRWVVTASHCFEDVNPHHVTIGDFDKFRRDQDEQKIAVLKFYTHPYYNGLYFDNDIALIYLRSEVQFNDFAIPICLPNPSLARMLLQEGETGMVSGWGSTRYMGPSSRFLLKVSLPVVSQKTCIQSTQQVITGSMFCAGYSVEARDSCKGDSGGPFVMSFRNTWYLMGVISWGEGCAEKGKYGVYTRVSDYIQWIKEVIEGINETEGLATGL